MEQQEFRVISDLSPIRDFFIEANFDDVQGWLKENLAPYQTMVVTEDSLPVAKSYRANINKLKAAIEENRKMVKKAVMLPYELFADRAKRLTELCDQAAGHLDTQIKGWEDQRRAEKEEALRAYYAAKPPEDTAYLPWERLFNPRWLNSTFSLEAAQAEIDGQIDRCSAEVAGLRELGSPFETVLLQLYTRTGDISACLRHNAELIQTQRDEDARRQAQAQAVTRAPTPAETAVAESNANSPAPSNEEPEVSAEVVTLDFRVTCTREQLAALANFLRENHIKYGRVPATE